MKRAMSIFLILSLLLCGCGKKTVSLPETTTSVTEAPKVLSPELDAYRRVLEGRMSIFRIASQESIPISKISLFFTVPWRNFPGKLPGSLYRIWTMMAFWTRFWKYPTTWAT